MANIPGLGWNNACQCGEIWRYEVIKKDDLSGKGAGWGNKQITSRF